MSEANHGLSLVVTERNDASLSAPCRQTIILRNLTRLFLLDSLMPCAPPWSKIRQIIAGPAIATMRYRRMTPVKENCRFDAETRK